MSVQGASGPRKGQKPTCSFDSFAKLLSARNADGGRIRKEFAVPLLPDRPSLRHLKQQARDLFRSGGAASLTDAQLRVARMYGFPSWPKLKEQVEAHQEAGVLKEAIDRNDFAAVRELMSRNRALHRAPIGYAKDGPLTWVAECRVPREPPGPVRLAMAKWMIENGSDVHQGGDAPLGRAALDGGRIPMMELLLAHGADVNAAWHGRDPILFSACETIDSRSLRWLLQHGADPHCGIENDWRPRGSRHPGNALDYLLGAYHRDPGEMTVCIDLLVEAGCRSAMAGPPVLAAIQNRPAELERFLNADPGLIGRRFSDLNFGVTATRMLTLRGGTLLHVAAEFLALDAAKLLLDSGAGVNDRAAVDETGLGGQTPIFHAATQFRDAGLPLVELLVKRGADLQVCANLPGHYEAPGQVVDCSPLGYALLFPGDQGPVQAYLREHGAIA